MMENGRALVYLFECQARFSGGAIPDAVESLFSDGVGVHTPVISHIPVRTSKPSLPQLNLHKARVRRDHGRPPGVHQEIISDALMKNGISPPMPSKKPEREFYVGEKVRVNLHAGKIVDATIRAIIPQTDGLRLQVDFGFEQTALIHVWQVVDD
jgi:hypothetical protein